MQWQNAHRMFNLIEGLMTFTKSESEKLIKPQGVISKITAPRTCDPKDYETSNVDEFASPTDAINPEKTPDLLTFMMMAW